MTAVDTSVIAFPSMILLNVMLEFSAILISCYRATISSVRTAGIGECLMDGDCNPCREPSPVPITAAGVPERVGMATRFVCCPLDSPAVVRSP